MAVDLVTPFHTYLLNVAAAMSVGDYDTALNNAYAAHALVGAMPSNLSRTAGGGGGSQSIASDADRVDTIIKRILQAQGKGQGVVVFNDQPVALQNSGSTNEVGMFSQPE